ncbi:MAG TPA: hypothetical protein VG984_01860 [Candidatus Paceibacterota bacterium]|nr:hypothetical protein [Candidatus Paceibacterota bacterium]
MREFKKRRSRRAELVNFSLRLAGALLLLFVTLGAVKGAWDMYGRLSVATAGQQSAAAQLANLKTQETAVESQVNELSSARGQEELLREHYGVAKPGEGVVQIVTQTSTSTSEAAGGRTWLGQLFHALFSW